MKYNLVDYFDVWFSEEEGYIVNDIARTDIIIDVTDDDSDEDIINKLIDVGFLKSEASNRVVIEWLDENIIEIVALGTGEPLGRLEKVN